MSAAISGSALSATRLSHVDASARFSPRRRRGGRQAGLLSDVGRCSTPLLRFSRPRFLSSRDNEARRRSRRFSSPEGEFPVAVVLSLLFTGDPRSRQEFPRVCGAENERSHFFDLLILIRGCLKPSSNLSDSSYQPRPADYRLTGWLSLSPLCFVHSFFVPSSRLSFRSTFHSH